METVKMEDGSHTVDLPSTPANTTRPGKSSFKFKNWDEHLLKFLEAAGLDQSAQGFRLDMMVMNHEREKRLLVALEQLCSAAMGKAPARIEEMAENTTNDSLDEMKRRYLPSNVATPNQNTKSISHFLADVRSRVNQSNRDEFVQRKRPRLDPSAPTSISTAAPTGPTGSARTDAVKLNRDVQMKYDIVKNEDGPLGKTMKSKGTGVQVRGTEVASGAAFSDRFETVEAHLALRYVPAPPADFMLRVKHIEDHIIRLEKEYPPWAALHFNQPHRGWPPPPRESIIVIPPHLTSSSRLDASQTQPDRSTAGPAYAQSTEDEPARGKGKVRAGRQESSLLRAALDKLEVQKALGGQL